MKKNRFNSSASIGKNIISPTSEKILPNLIASEIEEFYELKIPETTEKEEETYTLYRAYFGIFSKKIHVSFFLGKAIDYQIFYVVLGIRINIDILAL
jgi:hypothetical protein